MLKITPHGPVTQFLMGRSPMGFLLYPVNAYLAGDTLIDTGTNRAARPFLAALEGRKIGRVVNTHHHEDHIGNNRAVAERFGAAIYAHPAALPYLENPRLNRLRLYQRVVWQWPEPCTAQPLGDTVDAGEFRFNVIPSPGHTDDHVCLHEPDRRWLFTGDLFCGTSFIYLRRDEDYLVVLDTLKKLAGLDFDTIFCSLKGAVADGKEALRRKIARMEELRDRVLALHREGLPVARIRDHVLGHDGSWNFITGGHYSKWNAVASIVHGTRPDRIS